MRNDFSNSVQALPKGLSLFLQVLVATILLSFLDAFIRWPLQGGTTAFGALLLSTPFADINCYWPRFTTLHTMAFFQYPGQPWAYPAPAAFIYRFLYAISTYETFREVYLWLGIALLAIAASCFGIAMQREGLVWKKAAAFSLAASVLSWPIYFSFERGNIESYLWLMLACALVFYIRGDWHLAAIAIGFVAAFKIYPILFLGLFLPARRYRAIGEILLSASLTTLAGLLFLSRHLRLSARFIQDGIRFFLHNYSAKFLEDVNGYDHSLWALLKYPIRFHPGRTEHLLSAYTPLAGLLALVFYLTVLWKAPRFNQLLAICILMVMLPSTSFDYTLQSLYIPFAWLCTAAVRARRLGHTLPGVTAYFVAFALLFGPLVFIRGQLFQFGGQAKALVLLALLYLIARFPLDLDRLSVAGLVTLPKPSLPRLPTESILDPTFL